MNNKLVGQWKLQSWKLTDTTHSIAYPFGKDALGILIYTEYGFMSVHLMKNDIKSIKSESIFEATPQEALDLVQSYTSYCCKYSIDDERHVVQHHIDMMNIPNWIGKTIERYYHLENNVLTLTHKLLNEGQEKYSELIWNLSA